MSFNTTVRQMTEMFQWPKCLHKNLPKLYSEKNLTPMYYQYTM